LRNFGLEQRKRKNERAFAERGLHFIFFPQTETEAKGDESSRGVYTLIYIFGRETKRELISLP
jgi:hypothetical protein